MLISRLFRFWTRSARARRRWTRHQQTTGWGEIAIIETLEDRQLLSVVMSPQEQLLLELTNRARQNPQTEALLHGISVQETGFRAPLAPHQLLINAAGLHSQNMLDLDFFSHQAPDGSQPLDRVLRVGYPATIVGENIGWSGTTGVVDPTAFTLDVHRGLFLSAGHRAGMLDTRMREVGMGVRVGQFINPSDGRVWNALMATELFASRPSNNFLTGVAYTDAVVDDAFYTVGEGLVNVVVTAVNLSTNAVFATTTGPSGGYSIEVPNGLYAVSYVGGGIATPVIVHNVNVANANVKLDYDGSVPPRGPRPANVIVTGADAGGGPHVRVFDAQSGQEWLSLFPYDPAFTGGVRVATGDVNGDGTLDVITAPGPGGGPHVRVFDGQTGTPLSGAIGNFFAYDRAFTGGVNVATADVNRDGRADVITGADAGGGPHVRIFSGADGRELANFMAYDPAFLGGVRVAAGDVDGNGFPDVITAPGALGGPHVRVFSGLTGAPLAGPATNFMAYHPAFLGGVYVTAADVNLDGRADIVTGAGAGGGPHVRVFDGSTGAEMSSFFAYALAFTGGVRVGVSDIDNNHLPDIITAPGPGGGPHVRAFYGNVPVPLALGAFNFMAYSPLFPGGVFIAGGKNSTPLAGTGTVASSLVVVSSSTGSGESSVELEPLARPDSSSNSNAESGETVAGQSLGFLSLIPGLFPEDAPSAVPAPLIDNARDDDDFYSVLGIVLDQLFAEKQVLNELSDL